MQFIPPEFAQHSLVIQTLNSERNKQAKYMKTAMFITIQDKYKIILEYFAMPISMNVQSCFYLTAVCSVEGYSGHQMIKKKKKLQMK